MTTITINNQEVSSTIGPEGCINDIIDEILADSQFSGQVITKVSVNGKELSVSEEDQYLPTGINNYQDINFTTQTSIDLAYEALESCLTYIDVVTNKIYSLTNMYAENKTQEANTEFSEVIEIMDLFIQLISKIHQTIRANSKDKLANCPTIQKLEIHLLSILKALVPAKEKEDIIMLSDLLEYELIDNLTQWKIQAIPELKKLKNN